ncbi:tRNA-modifying protein YgfZ [Vibrio intestinalis]|uniref:tRNA-modifying protein YgfZ n=1 Tax=Vibrio intestinalis TaxID=2933291 RepID=UPI0021A2DA79|nr:tRNA-modifying protein YgfZ [Vibrio intestinalis]
MDWLNDFSPLSLTARDPLPELTLTHLSDWGVITAVGADAKSYLQGQVTCDVVQLAKESLTFGAHCDAKGKVWNVFRLFHHLDGYALVQPKSAMEKELVELKKYAIFSKIELVESEQVLLGLIGEKAEATIDQMTSDRGDVRPLNNGTAVKIDHLRWLIVMEAGSAELLSRTLPAEKVHQDIWRKLEIEAGVPMLEASQQIEHIPQALNVQALDGISFKKGCYTGQETVARAKYRGTNKRALFIVKGHADKPLSDDETIERSVGDNWRTAGKLLASYQYSDGETIATVVLPNNLDSDTQLRLASQPNSIWTMEPLPYSLDDE